MAFRSAALVPANSGSEQLERLFDGGRYREEREEAEPGDAAEEEARARDI
jgi:hypothetical protein